MSYTKRQFVEAAFEEAGMAAYVFDLSPQMVQSACRRLDSMLALWNAKGIRLAFPLPGSPENTDLDTETGVPDSANDAIITNLAIALMPSFGKAANPLTMARAKAGYDTLLARAAMPGEMQLGAIPSGAGHKTWDEPFLPEAEDPIQAGPDGELQF